MKVTPRSDAIIERSPSTTSTAAGTSFTEMLAGRDTGAAALTHRASSFLERGVLSPGGAPSGGEAGDPARPVPSLVEDIPAAVDSDTPRPEARPGASPQPNLTAGRTVAPARPDRAIAAGTRPTPTPTSLVAEVRAADSSSPDLGVDAERVPFDFGAELQERLASRTPLSIRLQVTDEGVIAVVVAADASSEIDEVAEDAFRFADERGLPLAGLVFNGVRLTRPQLR